MKQNLFKFGKQTAATPVVALQQAMESEFAGIPGNLFTSGTVSNTSVQSLQNPWNHKSPVIWNLASPTCAAL